MKRPFAKTTEQLQCSKAGNFTPDSGYMILYFSRVCLLIHLLRQKKIFAGINSKTWSFNKRMEISSAVERMLLRGGSKLGKNETYDADTLIIHDTACAYIFISTL